MKPEDENTQLCCHPECKKIALFEIHDEGGKYPFECDTFSCEEHLGSMIGSTAPAEPIGPWRVFAKLRASTGSNGAAK